MESVFLFCIGGYNVVCDFDKVPFDRQIRTIIKEVDIERYTVKLLDHADPSQGYEDVSLLYKDELFIKRIVEDDNLNCSLQVSYLYYQYDQKLFKLIEVLFTQRAGYVFFLRN